MRAVSHFEARDQISRKYKAHDKATVMTVVSSACNSAPLSSLNNMLRNLLSAYPEALITHQQSSPVLFCLTQQETNKAPLSVLLSHEITLSPQHQFV